MIWGTHTEPAVIFPAYIFKKVDENKFQRPHIFEHTCWREVPHLNTVKLVKTKENTITISPKNIIQYLFEIIIASAVFLLLRSSVEFWLSKWLPYSWEKSMNEWDGGKELFF